MKETDCLCFEKFFGKIGAFPITIITAIVSPTALENERIKPVKTAKKLSFIFFSYKNSFETPKKSGSLLKLFLKFQQDSIKFETK